MIRCGWEGVVLDDGVNGQRRTRGEAIKFGVGENTVRISWSAGRFHCLSESCYRGFGVTRIPCVAWFGW